jgi:hypothetical protein
VFVDGALEVRQEERVLFRTRSRTLVPHRSIALDAGWVRQVDLDGGPVTVSVA